MIHHIGKMIPPAIRLKYYHAKIIMKLYENKNTGTTCESPV